jgi:hypothetical protein
MKAGADEKDTHASSTETLPVSSIKIRLGKDQRKKSGDIDQLVRTDIDKDIHKEPTNAGTSKAETCGGTAGTTYKCWAGMQRGMQDRPRCRHLPNTSKIEELAQKEAKIKDLEDISGSEDLNLTKPEEKEARGVEKNLARKKSQKKN